MLDAAITADDVVYFDRRRLSRRGPSQPLSAACAVLFSLSASALLVYGPSVLSRVDRQVIVAVPGTTSTYSGFLDPAITVATPLVPNPTLKPTTEARGPAVSAPIEPPHDVAQTPPEATPPPPVEASVPPGVPAAAILAPKAGSVAPQAALPPQAPELRQSAESSVPLPTPRPVANKEMASKGPPAALSRQSPPRGGTSVLVGTPPDGRSFIEKLFGMPRPSGPALAYATPDDGIFDRPRSVTNPAFGYDRSTAVYDIAAHTVFMPNGERLEAHSGLGDRLDDPRFVHERMRGPTPPHVYELQPREQLFHGVQALRLNPVGGGGVFGRTGLLAHTYMLGPKGDSNGCVSFKDYGSFLHAYMRGEVRRLVVVARQY